MTQELQCVAVVAAWISIGVLYLVQLVSHRHKRFVVRIRNHSPRQYLPIVFQVIPICLGLGALEVGATIGVVLAISGVACLVAGLALFAWALTQLGQWWDAHASVQMDHVLVEKGPYQFFVHPIFVGKGLVFVGSALLSANVLAATFAALAVWDLRCRMRVEEHCLAAHLGSHYVQYCLGVRRSVWRLLAPPVGSPEPHRGRASKQGFSS